MFLYNSSGKNEEPSKIFRIDDGFVKVLVFEETGAPSDLADHRFLQVDFSSKQNGKRSCVVIGSNDAIGFQKWKDVICYGCAWWTRKTSPDPARRISGDRLASMGRSPSLEVVRTI